MDDLVRWLREQLATDERHSILWHSFECHLHVDVEEGGQSAQAAMELLRSVPGAVCSCGLPVRVLREIEAKRELLRLAERAHDYHETFTSGFASALERTLRMFALAYADRPGYRAEEWAP